MEWKDLVFMSALFVFAGVIFLSAFRRRKWCPDIFGSGKKDKPKQ